MEFKQTQVEEMEETEQHEVQFLHSLKLEQLLNPLANWTHEGDVG